MGKLSVKLLAKAFLIICICLTILSGVNAAARVSQLGFHPSSYKQVIVYANANNGTFAVHDATHTLMTKPLSRTTCQGGQPCLVGQFSSLTTPGTYYITTSTGERTEDFSISETVFSSQEHTLLEFFEAAQQRNSAFHADLHKAQDPPFLMMADGSFINEAWMSAFTLIRLGSAYNRNPSFFSTDKYTIVSGGLDILEHIRQHTDYLIMLQDATADLAVSKGWNNNFQCATATPTQEKWNDAAEPCMHFITDTSIIYTAETLLAYTQALPALQNQDSAFASALLERAKNTASYLDSRVSGSAEKSFLGAAYFQLFDLTGDATYLQKAYALRSAVSSVIDVYQLSGEEFYWEEYARHRESLAAHSYSYAVGGQDPANFLDDTGLSFSSGERVFESNSDFQLSRAMLSIAVQSAKHADLTGDTDSLSLADAQLAWLTGQNSIQNGGGNDPLVARSFIFGIGTNPHEYHSRLNPNQEPFLVPQGWTYIPGWVSGVYDSSGDGIYNHEDNYDSWRFAETTNHMVALAIETFAYLDALHNSIAPPADRTIADPTDNGTQPTPTTNPQDGLTRTDTDGGLSATFRCKPADTSEQLVVDWSFGDGQTRTDVAYTQSHTYASAGSYRVQCDAWDNSYSRFVSLGQTFSISETSTGTQSNTTNTSETPSNPQSNTTNTSTTTNTSNTTSQTNTTTNPPDENSNTLCYEHIADLPVTCTGGDIVLDSLQGSCRSVRCEGSGYLRVLACEKSAGFEMYRKETSSDAPDICLGGVCMGDWGYKRAEYPVCTEDTSQPSTPPTQDNSSQNSSSPETAQLRIKEWFPQGRNYVFICDISAPQYAWNFGDANAQVTTVDNVYHTYSSAGAYTVTCSGNNVSAALDIIVE